MAHAFLAPAGTTGLSSSAVSGLNAGAAARRRATCASRACSGLKAQAGDGDFNTLEEYKRRLKDVDELEAAPRVKRQADGDGGGLFGKLFASAKKVKACRTDYDCNENGRNWPLRCVDVIFTKVARNPDGTRNPKLETRNPKPETRNPKPDRCFSLLLLLLLLLLLFSFLSSLLSV